MLLMVIIGMLNGGLILSITLCLALAISACYLLEVKGTKKPFIAVAIIVTALLVSVVPTAALFIALLLPTVLHVFIFTCSFLLFGALKNNSKSALLTTILFLGLGISFFFIPDAWFVARYDTTHLSTHYFDSIVLYLAKLMGTSAKINSLSNIFAFLSFAYTYHYLNWFSKVEIIHWHKIPRQRWFLIGGLYAVAIGLYLYDYELGFKALLYISLLHVLLEFPLDIQTISGVFSELRRRYRLS